MSKAAERTKKAASEEEGGTAISMTYLPFATFGGAALVYTLKTNNNLNKCSNGMA